MLLKEKKLHLLLFVFLITNTTPFQNERNIQKLDKNTESASGSKVVNEHGIVTKRSAFVIQQITQIPDLRPGLDSPTSMNRPPFQGLYSLLLSWKMSSVFMFFVSFCFVFMVFMLFLVINKHRTPFDDHCVPIIQPFRYPKTKRWVNHLVSFVNYDKWGKLLLYLCLLFEKKKLLLLV